MNKTWSFVREPIRVLRIIYIILVQTALTGLQHRQVRLYSTVCFEAILLVLLVYCAYLFLVFGCALDDHCAAAQGF